MTQRRFLYIDPAEGADAEHNPLTDELTLAKLTLNGLAGVGINANGQSITGLPAGVNSSDAVNLLQLQNAIIGMPNKSDVDAVIATNVSTLSGTTSADGVTLSAGKTVLLLNQTNQVQNGKWTVQSGSWTRPTDFYTGASAAGTYFFVKAGTVYGDLGFICSSQPGSDIIDTNNLTFVQFTGAGEIIVNNPITKNLNTLSLALAANSGLQISGSGLDHLLSATGGLQKGASGLALLLADATLGLSASGLKNLGLPSLFTVNGLAVDANVTAAAFNALCDGTASAADAYHTHNVVNGANATLITNAQNTSVAVSAGDPAVIVGNNIYGRADAAANSTARVIGVWLTAVSANGTGTIVKYGTAKGILSNATYNTPYYLNGGGGYTTTPPSTGSGLRVVRLGIAANATDLDLRIQDMGGRSSV